MSGADFIPLPMCGGPAGRVSYPTWKAADRAGVKVRRRMEANGLDRGEKGSPEGRLSTRSFGCAQCGGFHWRWKRLYPHHYPHLAAAAPAEVLAA